jgi:uncharacterized protein YbbC (DUF1343 family)
MNFIKNIFAVGILLLFLACQSNMHIKQPTPTKPLKLLKVILGNENFISNHLKLIENKRVGLITNPSGVTSKLEYISDIFFNHPKINLVALFGPEHGIRGNEYGGDKVKDSIDEATQIPLFSLYGKTRKPSEEMMNLVDVLVFDIQDIGVRSYTYIYTMAKAMEACAEFNIPFIVLDRPNPLGGTHVEGNILDTTFSSFVGLYPLPYLHGMTIGELAKYFNIECNINCDLTVIPMLNWEREMNFGNTGLKWIPTSPHVPEWQTVAYLATTGTLGELHTVSIGVGYTTPFKLIGAPWANGNELSITLNTLQLPGVYFRPIYFKPFYSSFKGEMCQGIQLHITDYKTFKPYVTGLHIMQQLIQLYSEQNIFEKTKRLKMFNKVMGTDKIMNELKNNISVFDMEKLWQSDLEVFKIKRVKYLLY